MSAKKRLQRLMTIFLVLGLVAAVGYGASWLNHRRYFLIVAPGEVRVEKGLMLPYGHQPFIPEDPTIRAAYRRFALPGGMKVGRGKSVFDDRVELDQALFRLLNDAAEYALEAESGRTGKLLPQYLEQMSSIPGVSTQQQVDLRRLERDAAYVKGRDAQVRAVELLHEAAEAFRTATEGTGTRYTDAEERAERVERILSSMNTTEPPVSPPKAVTSTTSTRSLR
jgi:hypothetical protein